MEVATDQLDRLIERRFDSTPDPGTTEASYMESVRRYHARRRNEDLWDRLRYHEAMLAAHGRAFERLLAKHRGGRERCKAMLGIKDFSG